QLLGESGTGKEIFARSIHNWSDRAERPFIAINSVGLSKELLESELFGYEPGAFTGAQRDYFFRRDRRSLPRAPGKAFKIFTGARIRKSRRDHADLRRRESNCRD